MTNPPGAMPPLPEPRLWYDSETGQCSSMVPLRPTYEPMFDAGDLHAYAAPLIARVAELQAALTDALNAMDMQDKRESGEFHIPHATALGIWRDAQALARAALTPTKD